MIASGFAFATIIAKEGNEALILHGERVREYGARVVAKGRETKIYPFEVPASIRHSGV